MKAIKYFSIVAASLILASCAKEEIVPENDLVPAGSTTVTFVSNCDTKTFIGEDLQTTSWDGNENVLLWEEETQLTIDSKSYEGGILTITADVKSKGSTFYSIIGPKGDGNVTRTSAKVLAIQNPASNSFDPNAEILVAQPAKCGEGNTVALRYNRPVAITVATLKDLEAGEKVQSVTIKADKNLTGNVNFTYEGTNVKAEMDGSGNIITCEYSTDNTVSESGEFPVYFISLNADVTEFEFEVFTDKHKYYRKITRPEDSPIVLNDNRVATFGFKLENADKADVEGDKFVKVTSEPNDWSGEYLLVYEAENNKALCWTGVDAGSCYAVATFSNGEISAKPEGAVTLEIASMAEGYSIKVKGGINNGKYISGTSGSNVTNFGQQASLNTLSCNNDVIITSNTSVMKYNNASNGKWFRYYKSSSYSSQQPVQLYKKTAGGYGKYTLATPTNIQYSAETQKITWDAVENAGKYTISLNGGEPTDCSSNEYDASAFAAEYYYATVVAYPSAEKESTYQASSAGTNEGWLKIGDPTMKKIEAKDIDVLAGARSLEITWPEQTLATNGYSSELWSVGEGRKKLQEKTEIASDATSITYDGLEPNTKYRIYLTVKGVTLNDDRGERVYGECTTYKDPSTAQLFTIAEITKAGSYAIENAVVVAKANDGFLVKDNIDENAGYIMVDKVADDLTVGDIVSVSGTVESFNSQLRFKALSNYSKTGHNDDFVQPAIADKYTGNFEYVKYVNIIGKMTSSNGWLVTDATDNKLKVFANDKTGANEYVSVTGYLTHNTGYYTYLIATEIVEHTLTATPEELTWEATETDQKDVTIGINEGVDWTFAPTDNTDWNLSKNGNTLSVKPVSANTSTDKKELTVTLTHATNTQLTKTITITQKGVGGGTPHTYTMTIDSSDSGNNNVHWTSSTVTSLTYDNVTWTTSVTGTTSFTSSKTYCQVGSKTNPATKVSLTSSNFAGKTITSVKVTCYCASNSGPTLTVTAGSTKMIDNADLVKGTSTEMSSTDGTTATLGASDNLTIEFNSSAKAAIYISKIEVNYTD